VKERRRDAGIALETTPMIDVVFQLLIFFIVVLKQQDVLSRLEVMRPAAQADVRLPGLEILVYNQTRFGGEGFSLMGRQVPLGELDARFSRLSAYDKGMGVTVKCSADSLHANLVKVLDVCAKHELMNISVLSM